MKVLNSGVAQILISYAKAHFSTIYHGGLVIAVSSKGINNTQVTYCMPDATHGLTTWYSIKKLEQEWG